MISNKFKIDLIYLQKSRGLKLLKEQFFSWKSKMESLHKPTLDECLSVFSNCGFDFPRILQPLVDYPLTVFRVRVITADSKEDISDPKTFSYPPAQFSKTFQRANGPGRPVFYAAMDGMTAMEEVRLNGESIRTGDKIFLSQWRVRPGNRYSINYFTRQDIKEERHGFGLLTQKVYSEIDRVFASEDEFFLKRQRFLYEEIAKLFLTPGYHISGTIGHQVLYNTPVINGISIDGIAYPSCANNFRGINFAFASDFADRALELVSVRQVTFKEFVDNGVITLGNYNGILKGGWIKWVQYVAYLRVPQLSANIYLEENCPNENIMAAIMNFNDGRRVSVNDYCFEKANEIDLSNMQLDADIEKYYIEEQKLAFVLVLDFDEDIVSLETNGRDIAILKLEIVVPVDPKMREVNPSDVLASLKT